eukprot:m.1002888 g.1002888  ORF g.1002888 m.1002888 type:complete len:1315 (+) comp24038_c1_seq2:210-4154(+)
MAPGETETKTPVADEIKQEISATEERTDQDDAASSKPDSIEVHLVLPSSKPSAKDTATITLSLFLTDCVQDIRQFLLDQAHHSNAMTCFYFEHEGQRLNDIMEIGAISGLEANPNIHVQHDEYNDRNVRVHVRRLRELVQSQSRTHEVGASPEQPPSYLEHVLTSPSPVFVAPSGNSDGAVPEGVHNTIAYAQLYSHPRQKQTGNPASTAEGSNTVRDVAAIQSLEYSGWNPAPGRRVLRGDVLYLRAVTVEDIVVHIVATTQGFYVCRSTDTEFNPVPHKTNPCHAHTLAATLSAFCPLFRHRFQKLLTKTFEQDTPLETLPVPYAVGAWMCPRAAHTFDALRAEDAEARWSEVDVLNPGMMRDWNDEYQSLCDLEQTTDAAKSMRARALYKFHTDFVAAARRGAQAAVLGNLPPMNPADEPSSHMYVWNNMFFSYATDSRGIFSIHGGQEAAHAAANNDLHGVGAFMDVPAELQGPGGISTVATAVIDYLGRRVIAQSIIPGILRKEQSNTIVYGVNDVDKVMVVSDQFVTALKPTAAHLWSKEHRVRYSGDGQVYTLTTSSECKGILGTDGRNYALDHIRTTPVDVNFVDPSYVTDADRTAHLSGRINPAEAYHVLQSASEGPASDNQEAAVQASEWRPRHRLHVLRRELLRAYRDMVRAGTTSALDGTDKAGATTPSNSDVGAVAATEDDAADRGAGADVPSAANDPMAFNLDVFTNADVADADDRVAADKHDVVTVSAYLSQTVVPKFVGLLTKREAIPIDGEALTNMMHDRGINMRYIGCIASRVQGVNKAVCVLELVARAAKHRLRALLKATPLRHMAATVAHFLNCLVGVPGLGVAPAGNTSGGQASTSAGGKKKSKGKKKHAAATGPGLTQTLTPTQLWADISRVCWEHFRTRLAVASAEFQALLAGSISPLALVRAVCKKTGVQLVARSYGDAAAVSGEGHTANGWGALAAKAPEPVFSQDDILEVLPTVKHIAPGCISDLAGADVFAQGKHMLAQGNVRAALSLFDVAITDMQQTYGFMHRRISDMYQLQAYLLSRTTDAVDIYVTYQERAVVIAERVMGRDHPETIRNYISLGQYYYTADKFVPALNVLEYVRGLCIAAIGTQHPELAAIHTHIAVALMSSGQSVRALPYLDDVIARQTQAHTGTESTRITLAQTMLIKARAQRLTGDVRGALDSARTVHGIYVAELGADHERTQECFAQVTGLTKEAVALARSKKAPPQRQTSRPRPSGSAAPSTAPDTDRAGTNAGTNAAVVVGTPDAGAGESDDAYTPVAGGAGKKKKKRGHHRGKRTAAPVDGDQPRR